MKKEDDEITDLFRARLADAGITVRGGFWEGLPQDIPVACQHRRRLIFSRMTTAAPVLLVLTTSPATLQYLSLKEEMEEAFTKTVVANSGRMDGDGIRANQLPTVVELVLPKPAPESFGLLSRYSEKGDSVSVSLFISFFFSATTTTGGDNRYDNQGRNGYWQANNGNAEPSTTQEEKYTIDASAPVENVKKYRWVLKAQMGAVLPAEDDAYKMPTFAGVAVERKLNDYLGIKIGLPYSNLRLEGQHLHYLGILLKANITLMGTKKIDPYATVGKVADECVAGESDNSFRGEPIQLAVTAGIRIIYKINDQLAVFVEPDASHHFKTDSKLATVRTKRPTNFNLLCGLRMTY